MNSGCEWSAAKSIHERIRFGGEKHPRENTEISFFSLSLPSCNLTTLIIKDACMQSSPEAWARLVYRYRACPRQLDQAHSLLLTSGFFPRSENPERSIFIYNVLIASRRQPNGALPFFTQMLSFQIPPNAFTFPPLIKNLAFKWREREVIHAQLVSRGLVANNFVNSGMVKLYALGGDGTAALKVFEENPLPDLASCNVFLHSLFKKGDVASARRVFHGLPVRDLVSWTTMVDGFLYNGLPDEALGFFSHMCRVGVNPNEATLLCALSASANSKSLVASLLGKELHGYVIRRGHFVDAFVGTALVDMYGKRGRLRCASRVFDGMPRKEVCTWNAMISALASNGEEGRALELFKRLGQPNSVSFVAVLTACARGGLVDLGMELFASMREYAIVPRMEHCSCIVDMLGRAALLDEAAEFIAAMPFPADASVWGALLGACRLHGNADMAAAVASPLLGLQPGHGGRYATLWSTYAGEGMWASASRLKAAMDKAGVRKMPGSSWLQTDSQR